MTYKSVFAGLHILMRAILMAQRTLAAGFADTCIEKAAARSAPAGKNSVNPVKLRVNPWQFVAKILRAFCSEKIRGISVNPWLINDLQLRILTYEIIGPFEKTNPISSVAKST
jgi:hypothetical protein